MLILQQDNTADNERQTLEAAFTEIREIRTKQEDLKQSIQMGMQTMMNAMEQQMSQMNDKIESLQCKAMRYGQLDEYIERK